MIYVPLFGRMFPNAAAFAAKPIRDKFKDAKGMRDLFAQVFLDQCIHHPLLYFPAFYCTKELVMHKQPDIKRCLMEYKENMNEDLWALWKVWVPSTLVSEKNAVCADCYSIIPNELFFSIVSCKL